jgi:hypothetical protein
VWKSLNFEGLETDNVFLLQTIDLGIKPAAYRIALYCPRPQENCVRTIKNYTVI